MNVEARNSSKKRKSLFAADFRVFQSVMMQNPVIDPLRSCPLSIFLFKAQAAPGYPGKKAQIPLRLGINNSAVWTRRAIVAGFAGFAFTKYAGTTPFNSATVFGVNAPMGILL